jgi:hypothetical protein
VNPDRPGVVSLDESMAFIKSSKVGKCKSSGESLFKVGVIGCWKPYQR